MELSTPQQIQQLIKKSNRILITTSPLEKDKSLITQLDKVSSSLALYLILKSLGKKARITISHFSKQTIRFLPFYKKIKKNIDGTKDFILSINTKDKKVKKIRYSEENERFNIYLTPNNGIFESQDLSLKYGPPRYDLVIILDISDLEEIGPDFENNAELFYESPIINIDNKASNEYFGEINLVEITASSCAEIIFKLIQSLWPQKMNEQLATLLLAGIVSKTNSFQSYSTTPETFKISSELFELGADKDLIVQNLFKTKSFSLLKLLGRALARIKSVLDKKIIWTILTLDDFEKSSSSPEILDQAFEEFINFSKQSKIHCLFAQIKSDLCEFHIRTQKNFDIGNLIENQESIQKKTQGNLLYLKGRIKKTDVVELEKNIIDKLLSLPILQERV